MDRSEYRASRRAGKTALILELEAAGYTVKQLTEYQFRINGRLDLYPTAARWHNLKTGQRGGWGRETGFQVVERILGKKAELEKEPPEKVTILNWRKFKSRFTA